MSLYYNKVRRKNLKDPEGPKLWYPVLRSIGYMEDKELADRIAETTSLNPRDTLTVVYQMQKVMKDIMLHGRSIRLSDFGYYRLTINATGVNTLEEVTTDLIKRVNIRYQPLDQFKYDLNKATFIPMETLYDSTEVEEEG